MGEKHPLEPTVIVTMAAIRNAHNQLQGANLPLCAAQLKAAAPSAFPQIVDRAIYRSGKRFIFRSHINPHHPRNGAVVMILNHNHVVLPADVWHDGITRTTAESIACCYVDDGTIMWTLPTSLHEIG